MPIVSNSAPQPSNVRTVRPMFGQVAQTNERPKAKVWMNSGYEANGKFVTLPFGQPLDTMEPIDIRGHNPDYIKFCQARNAFLAAMQQIGDSLQPGEEVIIDNVQIRIRRVLEDSAAETVADNEYVVEDLATLLRGAKVQPTATT